jgi:hypothetical protein
MTIQGKVIPLYLTNGGRVARDLGNAAAVTIFTQHLRCVHCGYLNVFWPPDQAGLP